MSNKPIEPEDIVNDGVEEGSKAVPREGGSTDSGSTPSGISEGREPATGDTQKVPGPAEEQDEQTADDRGLTTDTTPD